MTKESILNKIKNLLNQTVDNGCTEDEAANAFKLARKLMVKYKIDEKDVSQKDSKVVQVELKDYNIVVGWVFYLINVFCENFGVLHYTTKRGRNHTLTLFGLETDVECVKELIDYAYNYAIKKSEEKIIEYRNLFGTIKGVRKSWCLGFVKGIEDKYKEQNKKQEYALMVVVDKDVQNEFNDFTSDFTKNEKYINTNISDYTIMRDGYNHGKKFGTTPLPEVVNNL